MNVIVTGASSGMGLATTRLFLERGHSVVMADRNAERAASVASGLEEAHPGRVLFCRTDVSDPESVEGLHRFATERLPQVDSIVNNAGVFVGGKLHETSLEDWDRVFAVDVKSVFLMARSFVPDMIARGKGTIVNTASVSGLLGDHDMAAYDAAKGALVNLVRAMALDYGPLGIRVNNVCPAACATPMFLSNPPETIALFERANPLGRVCTPEEVAEAIYFLATDASSSCNGINLELTGGLNVHTGQPAQ